MAHLKKIRTCERAFETMLTWTSDIKSFFAMKRLITFKMISLLRREKEKPGFDSWKKILHTKDEINLKTHLPTTW